jgi:hypothetical protein
MNADAFISTAVSLAWATFMYLVAYRFVIGLAPVVSVVAQAVMRLRPGLAGGASSWPWALLCGAASSPSAAAIATELRRFTVRSESPISFVAFLIGAHFLTPYYLLLIGPLLGKDALLSHLIGTAFCLAGVVGLWRPPAIPRREPAEVAPQSISQLARAELIHVVPQMFLGIVLGGMIAAWGLSSAHVALAALLGGGVAAQVGSALAGTVLGVASCLPPVASLFVATYLWKTGIAQAGLVSFVLASAATLTRRQLYRRALGNQAGERLWRTLLLVGVFAGIATGIIFWAFGLTIHYRLSSEQLL